MARRNQGRKRRDHNATGSFGHHHHEMEAPVDDMAIAASYAAAVYQAPQAMVAPVQDPQATTDSNEINLSEEEDEEDDDGAGKNDENGGDNDDNLAKKAEDASSTEDSDSSIDNDEEDNPLLEDHDSDNDDNDDNDNKLDIQKERSEIEKMEANTTKHDGEEMAAPRTENELDPYNTPLPELEKAFQFNLTVEERHTNSHGSLNICPAGKIKSHLIQERTVIVESVPQDGSSAPLDEGSLLVLRIQGTNAEEPSQLVPLGKVFEVFGPVRKPLYSVRIPPPQKRKKGTSEPSVSTTKPSEESVQIATNDVKDAKTETTKPDGQTSIVVSDTNNEEAKQELPTEKKADTTMLEILVPVEGSEEKSNDKEEPSNSEEADPWSQNGKYTSLLLKNPEFDTFYVKDEAKIIDAEAILRMSAKGCDASNIYDEEVVNVNEMAFSDDEEERNLKNRRKNRNKDAAKDNPRRRSSHQSNTMQRQAPIPSGFHQHPNQHHHFNMQRQPYYGAIPPPPPPPPPPPLPRGPGGGNIGVPPGNQFSHPPHPGPYAYAHHPMHPPQQQYPPQHQHQHQPYAAYPPSYPPQQYAPYPHHQQPAPLHPHYAPYPPSNPPHQQPYPITGQGQQPPPPGAPPTTDASLPNTSEKTQQQTDTVYYDYS